jgi:nickel/cobalt exporter
VTFDASFSVLLTTAASIALIHTVIGVDHTLPFVALGRARGWSLARVLAVTGLCGVGHVASSLVLGAAGIALGVTVERLQWLQSWRGGLAAWLLIGFGTWLVVRALWRGRRREVHAHAHVHADGSVHSHSHDHALATHRHPHAEGVAHATTVWTLFVVFAFGPCEPLIPLLMAPAAAHEWGQLSMVVLVFGGVTIGTMLALVAMGHLGLGAISVRRLEPHADAIAGATIALSGVAVQALGL